MQISILITESTYFWHLLKGNNGEIELFMESHGDDAVAEMLEQVAMPVGKYILGVDAQIEHEVVDRDIDGRPHYGSWLKWSRVIVQPYTEGK